VLAEWHTEALFSISKEYYDTLRNVCEKSSEIAIRLGTAYMKAFGRSLEIMWKRYVQSRVNAKQDFRVIFYENVNWFKTEPICWTVCERCSRVWL
jgi:hypothetical protein